LKHLTEHLWFNTPKRRDLVNITDTVEALVKQSGVQEGFCLVSAMHITASIWVNDDEEGLWEDFWELLERLVPSGKDYKHHLTGEDNGDAHLKRSLVGHQAMLPITKGQLDLGPWEQIFYAEFDGQRKKRVIVKILGE
jgi:secondary thiamine-phosphate synthase enzyme